jgi:hypothetical protein
MRADVANAGPATDVSLELGKLNPVVAVPRAKNSHQKSGSLAPGHPIPIGDGLTRRDY